MNEMRNTFEEAVRTSTPAQNLNALYRTLRFSAIHMIKKMNDDLKKSGDDFFNEDEKAMLFSVAVKLEGGLFSSTKTQSNRLIIIPLADRKIRYSLRIPLGDDGFHIDLEKYSYEREIDANDEETLVKGVKVSVTKLKKIFLNKDNPSCTFLEGVCNPDAIYYCAYEVLPSMVALIYADRVSQCNKKMP